jgi:hypothetical protein
MHLLFINSFNSYNQPPMLVLLVFPFHRREHQGAGRLSNLLKETLPGSEEPEFKPRQ